LFVDNDVPKKGATQRTNPNFRATDSKVAACYPELDHELSTRMRHSLGNRRFRLWSLFEFFEPHMGGTGDAEMDFESLLNSLGFGTLHLLTRAEWSCLKHCLGKPRRFSQQFLREERGKGTPAAPAEGAPRRRTRTPKAREGPITPKLTLPAPPPVALGTPCLGVDWHTGETTRGFVYSINNDSAKTYNLHPSESFAQIDLDPTLCKTFTRDCLMPLQQSSLHTPAATPHGPHSTYSVEHRPFSAASLFPMGGDPPACVGIASTSTAASPATAAGASSPMRSALLPNQSSDDKDYSHDHGGLEISAADRENMAFLLGCLHAKQLLIEKLREMNDEAEKIILEGDVDQKFKLRYAWLIIKIQETDEKLAPALTALRSSHSEWCKHVIARSTYEECLLSSWFAATAPALMETAEEIVAEQQQRVQLDASSPDTQSILLFTQCAVFLCLVLKMCAAGDWTPYQIHYALRHALNNLEPSHSQNEGLWGLLEDMLDTVLASLTGGDE